MLSCFELVFVLMWIFLRVRLAGLGLDENSKFHVGIKLWNYDNSFIIVYQFSQNYLIIICMFV